MLNNPKVGDIVKHDDAEAPGSIPAYRDLGKIVSVNGDRVTVWWSVDSKPEEYGRNVDTLSPL